MSEEIVVAGARLYLRTLAETDIGDEYFSWIKDPEVHEYLEVQTHNLTKGSLYEYLKGFDNKSTNFAFAIMLREGSQSNAKHIGNITPRVNSNNAFGIIGTLISPRYQGAGLGTEARSLICQFGFERQGLAKIVSGAAAANIASIQSNKRLGFVLEGHFEEHLLVNGERVDSVQLGLLKRHFTPFIPSLRPGNTSGG